MNEQSLAEIVSSDYEAYYSQLVTISSIDSNNEAHCICPVHGDSKASLHINMDTGKWHCKACALGGHDIISFYQFMYDVDDKDAEEELKAVFGLIPTAGDELKKYSDKLMKDTEALKYLQDRKISIEVLKKYKIGFDGMRFHIPILDFGNNIRNVRKHLKGKIEGQEKTISTLKGIGNLRLFPIDNVRDKKVYIFEGELDTLCAISQGLNAITVTGGAGSWKLEFNKYFIDKEVYICYDVDNTGINGAKKVANILSEVTDKIYLVDLPIDKLPEHGDFTDYIIKYSIEEFNKIKPIKFEGLTEEEAKKAIHEVHLAETTNSYWYNKRIKTTAIVTGKGSLFLCPKKVEITCNKSQGVKCDVCSMTKYNFKRLLNIKPDNPKYLHMVRVAEDEQKNIIKRLSGIPLKCMGCKLNILEAINIEQVAVIPEIDYNSTSSTSYVSRLVYIVGNLPLETNKPYTIDGLVLPFPRSQESTMLVYNAESTKDNIDSFEVTPEVVEQLSIFKAETVEDMQRILKEKYSDYEAITRIYKRESLFLAVDVIFHSVLSFKFQDKLIKRGHVNGLIFGDTRTGKSETVDNLMSHFRAGDTVGGENVTFAGLVGGVHKIANGEKWGITWKVIPLNDRRLVKIDEFHGMSDEDVGKLSEIVSTGIANIQKIHNERTLARTRLIFVANGKYGKHLSDHQFGCQAIPAIMGGHNEDIARLDFALAVATDDINTKDINKLQEHGKRTIEKYSSDICHNLIMWAWSRKQADVIFTKEAEQLIMRIAEEQTDKYHISIPLVPTAEHSVKLARMSCSIACMFFSTDELGHKLIVKDIHVKLAKVFLDNIYSAPAMKFDVYSNYMFSKDKIKDIAELKRLGISEATRDLLLNIDKLNQKQVETIFNCQDKDVARETMFVLLKNNALKPYGANLYTKTPAFIKFLTSEKFNNEKRPNIFSSAF
jgi:hypothetical protein